MENHPHGLKASGSKAKAPPELQRPPEVRKQSNNNPMAVHASGSSDFSSLHQAKPLVQARSLAGTAAALKAAGDYLAGQQQIFGLPGIRERGQFLSQRWQLSQSST